MNEFLISIGFMELSELLRWASFLGLASGCFLIATFIILVIDILEMNASQKAKEDDYPWLNKKEKKELKEYMGLREKRSPSWIIPK